MKTYSLLLAMFFGAVVVSSSANAQTLGDMVARIESQVNVYQLVAYLAYMAGILFTAIGIHKLRQHVEFGPQSVQLPEPLKYLFAGGLMLALPVIASVATATFGDQGDGQAVNTYGLAPDAMGVGGLDNMLVSAMQDMYVPLQYLLVFFCFAAGAVLTMVAIHRFTKTAQEGPRGPTGLGTIATFALAGVLFSIGPSVGMLTETLFGDRTSNMVVDFMMIDAGIEKRHAENVATGILMFLVIVGIISVIRGFFVLRGVAEGNQQMTMMSGLSHIIAGAILVNFGQFAVLVQKTLGIDAYGVLFY